MEWFESLRQFADAHAGIIALAALIIIPLGGFLALTRQRFGQIQLIDQIRNRENWPLLIAQYQSSNADRYFAAIERLLAFATRFYGAKPLSWQAFYRCLAPAFIYPVIAVLLSWVVANQHSPGGMSLLADDPVWWSRFGKGLLLMAAMVFVVWIIGRSDRLAEWALEKQFGPFDKGYIINSHPTTAAPRASEVIVGLLAICVAVAFTFAVTLTFTRAVAEAVRFAIVVAFAATVAGAVAGAVAFARVTIIEFGGFFANITFIVAYAVAFVGAFAFFDEIEPVGLIFSFFLFLPFLNAFADMLSLAATRWFLGNVTPPQGPDGQGSAPRASLARILVQLALDLGVALICLGLLIGLITAGLDFWAQLLPASLPFDWRAYWAVVQEDRSAGWALYLMVATTLLPTAIHVIAGLGAVLTHRSRQTASVARRLEQAQAEGTTLLDPELNILVSKLHRATLWGYGVAAFAVVIGLPSVVWAIIRVVSWLGGADTT